MSSRFAGSQRLDERRRRRLVSDGETAGAVPHFARESSSQIRIDSAPRGPVRRQVLFPLRVLIPTRPWLHGLFAFNLLLTGVGLLAARFHLDQFVPAAGPGLARLLGPTGRIVAVYHAGMLLAAMQLSLLICWVRSRSHADYSGRYLIWRPVAWACGAFAVSLVADVHIATAETLGLLLPKTFWRQDVLLWLIPSALAGLLLAWRLRNELRDSRASSACLTFAGLLWWLASLMALDLVAFSSAMWGCASTDGVLLLGNIFLLLSLSLHARHVLHHSADPPALPKRSPIPRPHFRWLRRSNKVEPENSSETTADEGSEETPSKRRKPVRKRKPARKKSSTDPSSSEAGDAEEFDDPVSTETEDFNDEASMNASDEADKEELPEPEPTKFSQPQPQPQPQFRSEPIAAPPRHSALGRGLSTPPVAPMEVSENESDDADDDTGDADDGQNLSSIQGLSRKQRRKLEKQLRRQQGR